MSDNKRIPLVPWHKEAQRPTTTERGYGAEWQKVRQLVLAGHPLCQWCQEAWSQHVHHIDHNTGNNSPTNLAALCERCHMSYHKRKQK